MKKLLTLALISLMIWSFSAPAVAQSRTAVEVVSGALKVFPNAIGTFDTVPTSLIAQINGQARHGYNNWRLPTSNELSLLRAKGFLGEGQYMSKENPTGIVLLVTDGDDYATIQKKAADKQRRAGLRAQGWIDLGLPSGTLWKNKNEEGGFYTYDQAIAAFGSTLPTQKQFEELRKSCHWTWTGNGYKITGPSGETLILPAAGYRNCKGVTFDAGSGGNYWTSTVDSSESVWYIYFLSNQIGMYTLSRCYALPVRLVR